MGVGTGKLDKEVQISNYKLSQGSEKYNLGNIVSNIVINFMVTTWIIVSVSEYI